MKGVIVYKGKYGATRTYAVWLSRELQLPVKEAGEIKKHELEKYDFLIAGSAVYFGKLLLRKWFKKHRTFLQDKKIFIFSVSGTSPDKRRELGAVIDRSVAAEVLKTASVYFLPGKMDLDKLSWPDRFMMKMGARMSKDPVVKKEMLRQFNAVHKQHINDLKQAVIQYCNSGEISGNIPASQAEDFAR